MTHGLRDARRAIARGDEDAALALLWNALEPARLVGDRRALRTIEVMAARIADTGDEAHRREAERLVEALHELAEERGATIGTAGLEADVSTGGAAPTPDELGELGEPGDAEPQRRTAQRIASLVWLLVLVAVVIANILGGRR